MKKILFPYDSAADNRNAFMHAAKIASLNRSELIILNASNFEVDHDVTEAIYKKRLQKTLLEISNEVRNLKVEFTSKHTEQKQINFQIEYEIVYGNIKTEIEDFLKKHNIDLMIFTAHESNKKGIQLTKERLKSIFNSTNIPTLVVPELDTYSPVKKIGYATNLHRIKNSKQLIPFATQFAQLFGAYVHFIHVSRDGIKLSSVEDKETYTLIENLSKNNPNKYSFDVLNNKNIVAAMSEFIKESAIDMVIVVKQNKNFFESLFQESLSNQLSLYSKEPILILHENDK